MVTTTITITDDLEAALDDYRRQHDLPGDLAAVVQALIHQHLTQHGYLVRRPYRPLRITPAEQGSGLTDVSINHDRYFAESVLERKAGGPR